MNAPETIDYATALDSSMSPLAMAVIGALVVALLIFRSRYAAGALIIAGICYLPQTEALNLGFHFYSIRLVLLAGIVRVLIRGENRDFRFGKLDKALLLYSLTLVVMSSLRAPSEFTYRLGGLYDVTLGYYVFRSLIRNTDDFQLILSRTAYVLIPFAGLMLFESFTNHNPFSVFHGVYVSSEVRYDHVRAVGTFRNAITAGAFGASFFMFYGTLFFARVRTLSTYIGLLASLAVVYAAHASGPFLGVALGLLSFALWKMRKQLKMLLWSLVGLLFVLQLVMKKPVWFLIGRASGVAGGGGFHRSLLIDRAITYYGRWALCGTTDTGDWFPYSLESGSADITNFFIAAGVIAGTLGLIASIALIVVAFKELSRGLKARGGSEKKLVWGIGATLVATIGILFSVTYMDQMQIVFLFLLASIAALASFRPATIFAPVVLPPARKREHVEWRERLEVLDKCNL
jgi:hypothetical protein